MCFIIYCVLTYFDIHSVTGTNSLNIFLCLVAKKYMIYNQIIIYSRFII